MKEGIPMKKFKSVILSFASLLLISIATPTAISAHAAETVTEKTSILSTTEPFKLGETFSDSISDPEFQNKLQELNQLSKKITDIEDTTVVDHYSEMAKSALKNGEIKKQSPNTSLDFNNVHAIKVMDEGNEITVASIPIVGEKYSPVISSITVYFDNDDIFLYGETLYSKGDKNCFKIDQYFNGNLLESKQILCTEVMLSSNLG